MSQQIQGFIAEVLASSVLVIIALSAAGWLSRTWIKERLTAALKLETESKLDRLRAELTATENRLETIRQAGVGAMASISSAANPARVEAIKTLWSATFLWQRANAVISIVSFLNREYVQEHGDDPGLKDSIKKMLESVDHLELMRQTSSAEEVRPFVSERAWATFYAYHSFHASRLLKAVILTMPGKKNAVEIWDRVDERALIAQSAPTDILGLYDSNFYHGSAKYLTYLKNQFIEEARRMLSGEQSSAEASQHAARVVATADDLIRSAQPTPTRPQVGD